MNKREFHIVDVFTEKPFAGNPLAIVEQADGLSDVQMQTLAREFNLSETIFIQRPNEPKHAARVRIFLPRRETPFAGHPTIGCAIFIAQKIYDNGDDFETEIILEEVAGLVPVRVARKDGAISAQLVAPVVPHSVEPVEGNCSVTLDVSSAAEAYCLSENDIEIAGCGPMAHAGGPTFIFVPVNSREALSRARAAEPLCTDLPKAYRGTGGYVYYLSSSANEVHARMFAPGGGIAEDPATGSASAILASQLLLDKRLREGTNKFELYQGYDMGRPSQLALEVDVHNGCIESVRLSGTSVPISSGITSIPE